ncbi:MAG TPA: hypothetical protein VLA82_13150 [Actinomycetota bacterium]|nr:hypothetical protein [Actinomycetota bacterium]
MDRRKDRWAGWRRAEPEVEPPRRGSMFRRRRVVRTLEEDPDALRRRWWIA